MTLQMRGDFENKRSAVGESIRPAAPFGPNQYAPHLAVPSVLVKDFSSHRTANRAQSVGAGAKGTG